MVSARFPAILLIGYIGLVPAWVLAAQEYRDATHGFSLEPPVFKASTTQGSVQVATFAGPAEDGFAPNCNVQIQTAALSLDAYENLTDAQFKAAGWVVSERSRQTVSGKPAVRWRYSGAMRGRNFEWLALVAAGKGRFYLLTCTALQDQFAENLPAFKRSIDSFGID